MSKSETDQKDKEIGELNDRLLQIASRLREIFDEEVDFTLMKIEAASRDIHNLRIKHLLNANNNGV